MASFRPFPISSVPRQAQPTTIQRNCHDAHCAQNLRYYSSSTYSPRPIGLRVFYVGVMPQRSPRTRRGGPSLDAILFSIMPGSSSLDVSLQWLNI